MVVRRQRDLLANRVLTAARCTRPAARRPLLPIVFHPERRHRYRNVDRSPAAKHAPVVLLLSPPTRLGRLRHVPARGVRHVHTGLRRVLRVELPRVRCD
jgi:hypothetical protein